MQAYLLFSRSAPFFTFCLDTKSNKKIKPIRTKNSLMQVCFCELAMGKSFSRRLFVDPATCYRWSLKRSLFRLETFKLDQHWLMRKRCAGRFILLKDSIRRITEFPNQRNLKPLLVRGLGRPNRGYTKQKSLPVKGSSLLSSILVMCPINRSIFLS